MSNIQYQQPESLQIIKDIGNQVANGLFNSLDGMFGTVINSGGDLLDLFLEPVYTGASDTNSIEMALKRKKKKKKGQDQSMGISR